jgi:hypothetical protein
MTVPKLLPSMTPIVGKYYMVKCALVQYKANERYYTPVIGEPHTDVQFDFKWEHIHIDGRFANRNPYLDLRDGKTNSIFVTDLE